MLDPRGPVMPIVVHDRPGAFAFRSRIRMSPDLTLSLVIIAGVLIAMGLMVLSARESRRGGMPRDRS
jgi:hypothetical protein